MVATISDEPKSEVGSRCVLHEAILCLEIFCVARCDNACVGKLLCGCRHRFDESWPQPIVCARAHDIVASRDGDTAVQRAIDPEVRVITEHGIVHGRSKSHGKLLCDLMAGIRRRIIDHDDLVRHFRLDGQRFERPWEKGSMVIDRDNDADESGLSHRSRVQRRQRRSVRTYCGS